MAGPNPAIYAPLIKRLYTDGHNDCLVHRIQRSRQSNVDLRRNKCNSREHIKKIS